MSQELHLPPPTQSCVRNGTRFPALLCPTHTHNEHTNPASAHHHHHTTTISATALATATSFLVFGVSSLATYAGVCASFRIPALSSFVLPYAPAGASASLFAVALTVVWTSIFWGIAKVSSRSLAANQPTPALLTPHAPSLAPPVQCLAPASTAWGIHALAHACLWPHSRLHCCHGAAPCTRTAVDTSNRPLR